MRLQCLFPACLAAIVLLPLPGHSQNAPAPPVQGYRNNPVFIWQPAPGGSFSRTSATLQAQHLAPQSLQIITDPSQTFVEVTNGQAKYWVAAGDLQLPPATLGAVCSDLVAAPPGQGAQTEGMEQACNLRQ